MVTQIKTIISVFPQTQIQQMEILVTNLAQVTSITEWIIII